MNDNSNAFKAYEAVLKKSPNRFNSLYGAGKAAEKSGSEQKAIYYYKQLSAITDSVNFERQELDDVRKFLKAH
jgi:predicted TPR repeat methyltransferase